MSHSFIWLFIFLCCNLFTAQGSLTSRQIKAVESGWFERSGLRHEHYKDDDSACLCTWHWPIKSSTYSLWSNFYQFNREVKWILDWCGFCSAFVMYLYAPLNDKWSTIFCSKSSKNCPEWEKFAVIAQGLHFSAHTLCSLYSLSFITHIFFPLWSKWKV